MATLTDLGARMRQKARDIPIQANELKKQVVISLVTDLVYVTPVDTSNALSKWDVATNPIFNQAFAPYYLGERGSTRGASAQAGIAEARQVLSSVKPGQPVYVGNAAPYIRKLNDEGSSKQEPAGFVERAKVVARSTIGKVGLRLK